MNFLSMRYFLVVSSELSFTKAADILFITQQTLSAHIASLEKELGCKLFVRSSPLQLTYAGEAFHKYAKQFEKLEISLKNEFDEINSKEKGLLKIGIAHTRGRTIMPHIVNEYSKIYPKMEFKFLEGTNDVLQQELLNKELDLIIASFLDEVVEIESKHFYDENIVLLVSRNLLTSLYGTEVDEIIQHIHKTKDISMLAPCPFLMCDAKDVIGKIGMKIISEAGFIPNITVQSNNVETLLKLCISGKGACFCPDILVSEFINKPNFKDLIMFHFDDSKKYPIQFGWLNYPHTNGDILRFINYASKLKPHYNSIND